MATSPANRVFVPFQSRGGALMWLLRGSFAPPLLPKAAQIAPQISRLASQRCSLGNFSRTGPTYVRHAPACVDGISAAAAELLIRIFSINISSEACLVNFENLLVSEINSKVPQCSLHACLWCASAAPLAPILIRM